MYHNVTVGPKCQAPVFAPRHATLRTKGVGLYGNAGWREDSTDHYIDLRMTTCSTPRELLRIEIFFIVVLFSGLCR